MSATWNHETIEPSVQDLMAALLSAEELALRFMECRTSKRMSIVDIVLDSGKQTFRIGQALMTTVELHRTVMIDMVKQAVERVLDRIRSPEGRDCLKRNRGFTDAFMVRPYIMKHEERIPTGRTESWILYLQLPALPLVY